MSIPALSRIPELQAAVRALSGVADASVRWPEPGGPATLRIEFEDSADRDSVTATVLDTLRTVAEVDLASLHVALPAPPGVPAQDCRERDEAAPTEVAAAPRGASPVRRPVFHAIEVSRTALDVGVSVTLAYGDRRLVGSAEGLATRQAAPRVAAAATLVALRELLTDDTRLHVDWLEIHDAEHPVRPGVVQVAVAMLSGAGEEVMIGSAMLRDDAREGAVRATLDALNRRLARIGGPPPQDGQRPQG